MNAATSNLLPLPKVVDLLGNSERDILKKMEHVIKDGGTPEQYRSFYYAIPASNKNLRAEFLWRIHRKARQENWMISQLREIMDLISS